MDNICCFSTKKTSHLLNSSFSIFISFPMSSYRLLYSYLLSHARRLNPFSAHLLYFIFLSLVGFLAMKVSNPSIKDFDLFFTSVSSATVSSMAVIEMEVFSNSQILIIIVLMLVGGEVFTSMISLPLMNKFKKMDNQVESVCTNPDHSPVLETSLGQVELGLVNHLEIDNQNLKCKSIKCLTHVVLCYFFGVHIFGVSLVTVYMSLFSSARHVIKKKGIDILTFSTFVVVSTFANCGFTPTNENMMVFKKNSGLLLILIAPLLLGNVLFAPCLHILIWVLERFTKREEFRYLLKNHKQVGYCHLLPKLYCLCIVGTAFGFILLQFIFFCSLEWNSEIMEGLNSYEKFVASLFQVANVRHAGEYVFDISIVSPPILVMFIVMMYLPSYTSLGPIEGFNKDSTNERKTMHDKRNLIDYILFSQLSYLVIFIILVCVTERDKMRTDPLNFNVLNITLEIISAYGNVGFSTGYSCARRLNHDNECRDATYGLVGKWSDEGKLILIIVMIFGRLKNFSKGCGKAWHT